MLKNKYTRRTCLKILGTTCLCSSFPKFFVTPVMGKETEKLHKVQKTLPLMATYVNITVYDHSKDKALMAVDKAFNKIQELISIFNRFDKNSHISYLNENKKLIDVPPEFREVLKTSQKIAKLTSYEFDITILPLLEEIENEIKVHGHFPELKKIKEILPYIGWNNLKISDKKIELASQSKITLDGIAKGYIVDEAAFVLKQCNISHAIIDAGGDIRTIGSKISNIPWTIGIEAIDGSGRAIKTVKLNDMAIATSGNYRNFFDKSRKIHHIITKDGITSPKKIASISVISKSATIADGLATGLFVLTKDKAITIANKFNLPIMVITPSEKIYTSNQWRQFV